MTPLGLLNFVVLQWFGVRLASVLPRGIEPGLHRIVSIDGDGSAYGFSPGDVVAANPGRRYRLLRWVWPLTGWWRLETALSGGGGLPRDAEAQLLEVVRELIRWRAAAGGK